jgi:hypothetical protein
MRQFFIYLIVLCGLCFQEPIIAVSRFKNKVPVARFINRNATAREGNLRDGASRHEEFALLHPKTSPHHESDRPCPAIDQKIVNDAEVLLAIVDFVTGDRNGAAQVRIGAGKISAVRTGPQQILAAHWQNRVRRRKRIVFGARERRLQNVFVVVDSGDQCGTHQRRFMQARRVLRNHDVTHRPILIVEIKIDSAAGQTF